MSCQEIQGSSQFPHFLLKPKANFAHMFNLPLLTPCWVCSVLYQQPPFHSYHLSSHTKKIQQLSPHRRPLATFPGQSSTRGSQLPQPMVLASLRLVTLLYASGQFSAFFPNRHPNAKSHLSPERFSGHAADGKEVWLVSSLLYQCYTSRALLKKLRSQSALTSCSFMGCGPGGFSRAKQKLHLSWE